jgi:hypothetical protein
MRDFYLFFFHSFTFIGSLLILWLVMGKGLSWAMVLCNASLILIGALIGGLGNYLGSPWLAYYTLPGLVLITLGPPVCFSLMPDVHMSGKKALAYIVLSLAAVPLIYGVTTAWVSHLAYRDFNTHSVLKDFERGTFQGWYREFAPRLGRPGPQAVQIVPDPVQADNRVARFELRHSDPKVNLGHRAELSEYAFKAPFHTDLWYAFRTFIPEAWPNQDVRCLIAQWHAWHDWAWGEALRSPVLGIEYRDSAFLIRLCHSDVKIQTDNSSRSNNKTVLYISDEYAQKGVWHDFVVNVRWSPQEDGYLNVWIDDHQVVRYRGPIGYKDALGPYFKMGIYRDDVPDTFVLHHDAYRRGYSADDIAY